MEYPWAQTTGWALTVGGGGVGGAEENNREKCGTTVTEQQ